MGRVLDKVLIESKEYEVVEVDYNQGCKGCAFEGKFWDICMNRSIELGHDCGVHSIQYKKVVDND